MLPMIISYQRKKVQYRDWNRQLQKNEHMNYKPLFGAKLDQIFHIEDRINQISVRALI